MNYIIIGLIFTKLLSLFLGMTIAYLTYKMGKRYEDRFMLTLSLGFSLIAIGSFFELLLDIIDLDIDLAHLVESVILILGMGIIAYTLILKER